MVAIIGGGFRRFRPLVDLYRETGIRSGHSLERLKVGVHALGDVAATSREAADDFFPGYARAFTDIGKERGWSPITRAQFDAQLTPQGALLVGDPDEVIEKIGRYAASLPHEKLMQAIELLGPRVVPALNQGVADVIQQ